MRHRRDAPEEIRTLDIPGKSRLPYRLATDACESFSVAFVSVFVSSSFPLSHILPRITGAWSDLLYELPQQGSNNPTICFTVVGFVLF